jgi:hypothetical protein
MSKLTGRWVSCLPACRPGSVTDRPESSIPRLERELENLNAGMEYAQLYSGYRHVGTTTGRFSLFT